MLPPQVDGLIAAVLFDEEAQHTPSSAESHTLGVLGLDAYKKQKLVRLDELQVGRRSTAALLPSSSFVFCCSLQCTCLLCLLDSCLVQGNSRCVFV